MRARRAALAAVFSSAPVFIDARQESGERSQLRFWRWVAVVASANQTCVTRTRVVTLSIKKDGGRACSG